jgi:hypothetical protein
MSKTIKGKITLISLAGGLISIGYHSGTLTPAFTYKSPVNYSWINKWVKVHINNEVEHTYDSIEMIKRHKE